MAEAATPNASVVSGDVMSGDVAPTNIVSSDVAPVIIEVALNGITRKDRNPAAPETPAEIATDACACLDAGAAIVHTHATSSYRDPSDSETLAAEYAEAFEAILTQRPDAVLYPTMSGGQSIQQRWGHHEILAERGLIHAAVVDPGSVNLGGTGEDGLPRLGDYVYVNSNSDIRYMMERCEQLGLGPSMAIYEPGFFRVPLAYQAAGKLPAGTFSKFYFTGSTGYFPGSTGPLFSAPPLPESLEMYLAMLDDGMVDKVRSDKAQPDTELSSKAPSGKAQPSKVPSSKAPLPWGVSVITGSLLDTPIAAMAIERGGHLRVGLEDNSKAESNLEQVKRAVALCEQLGRRPATPTEAKEILGLRI